MTKVVKNRTLFYFTGAYMRKHFILLFDVSQLLAILLLIFPQKETKRTTSTKNFRKFQIDNSGWAQSL